jgi:hypothetical protein
LSAKITKINKKDKLPFSIPSDETSLVFSDATGKVYAHLQNMSALAVFTDLYITHKHNPPTIVTKPDPQA